MFFPFGNDPAGTDAVVAVHLVHLHTGQVMVCTYISQEPYQGCDPICLFNPPPPYQATCVSKNFLWTPPPADSPGNPGQFQSIPNCHNWLFCVGHSAMADGRILFAGSEWADLSDDAPYADIFDPNFMGTGPAWNMPSPPPNMAQGRWYPSTTTLPDGKVLVTSGWEDNPAPGPPADLFVTIPELYDPATPSNPWTRLFSAERVQELYPFMFVLPDGSLVDAGPGPSGRVLISSPTWTWAGWVEPPLFQFDPPLPPPWYGASAVMYEPGKIMKCGGNEPGVATTWVVNLDFTDPNNPNAGDPYDPPTWMIAGNMNKARVRHNLVVLPDGKILALGGSTEATDPVPVNEVEIYDPASGTWTLGPAADIARMYHSTAMLLPDGRVVSAGGDGQPTAQIYRPPYLTSGMPRPVIVSAPSYVQYGQQYSITYNLDGWGAVDVSHACLIRLAAVTHGFDQDQRRVPLTLVAGPSTCNETCITVAAPANGNIAPPGYYMLFILTEYARNQFMPSVATYVQVGP